MHIRCCDAAAGAAAVQTRTGCSVSTLCFQRPLPHGPSRDYRTALWRIYLPLRLRAPTWPCARNPTRTVAPAPKEKQTQAHSGNRTPTPAVETELDMHAYVDQLTTRAMQARECSTSTRIIEPKVHEQWNPIRSVLL